MRHIKLVTALAACSLSACPSGLTPPTAIIAAGVSTEAERGTESCAPAHVIEGSVGQPVQLHGACSEAGEDVFLTYKWSIVDQPNGSLIELPNDSVVSPTIVPDLPGTYRVALFVSAGALSSEVVEAELEVSAEF